MSFREILDKYRWNYHWHRANSVVPSPPFYVNVEPTNLCNFRCKVCSLDGSGEKGFMEMGLFRRIIDEAKQIGVHEIAHFLGGEPLLHPEITEMVDYVKQKGLRNYVHSNASRLTPDISERFLRSGLDYLGITFDGDEKETYERMRPGSSYERTLENFTEFLRLKQALGAKTRSSLKILKPYARGAESKTVRQDFLNLFAGLPLDEIVVTHPHTWRGEKMDNQHSPYGEYYYPCYCLWGTMSIGWNGRVHGCSADLNGNVTAGDLNHQSIMEIWNSETFKLLRKKLKGKEYKDLELCKDCSFLWHNRPAFLKYLTEQEPLKTTKRILKKVFGRKYSSVKFPR